MYPVPNCNMGSIRFIGNIDVFPTKFRLLWTFPTCNNAKKDSKNHWQHCAQYQGNYIQLYIYIFYIKLTLSWLIGYMIIYIQRNYLNYEAATRNIQSYTQTV